MDVNAQSAAEHPRLSVALSENIPWLLLPPHTVRLDLELQAKIEYNGVLCLATPTPLRDLSRSKPDVDTIVSDLSVASMLKHPTVADFIGLCIVPSLDGVSETTLWVLTKCTDRTIRDVVTDNRHGTADAKWSVTQRLRFLHELMCGIVYLHSKGIAGLWLNSQQVWVDSELRPLISVVGINQSLPMDPVERLEAVHADVYAFGMLAKELLADISSPEISHGCPQSSENSEIDLSGLWSTLESCTLTDSNQRLSAEVMCGMFSKILDSDSIDPVERAGKRAKLSVESEASVAVENVMNDNEYADQVSLLVHACNLFYGRDGIPRDIPSALRLLSQLADAKQPRALLIVGLLHYDRSFEGFTHRSRGELLLSASSRLGDPVARVFCLKLGIVCLKNPVYADRLVSTLPSVDPMDAYVIGRLTDSAALLKHSSDCGNILAAVHYIERFVESDGDHSDVISLLHVADGAWHLGAMNVVANYSEDDVAVGMHLIAARLGSTYAMIRVGVLCERGQGIIQCRPEAVNWYLRAAEAGDTDAMMMLAKCYSKGIGVQISVEKQTEWYRRAAVAGNDFAMIRVACAYESGSGVPQSNKEAVCWYHRAAEAGNTNAMADLGYFYAQVCKNADRAVEWYTKAVNSGHSGAMYNLGIWYDTGAGGETCTLKAATFYQKAAEAGNVNAMYNLGVLYARGKVVDQSNTKAVELYNRAAEAGCVRAMHGLGSCYEHGTGVPRSVERAVEWYRKAAEGGYSKGMYDLALCIQKGKGVAENAEEAAKWFRASAETGHSNSMVELGVCYQRGTGVKKNPRIAFRLYKKAANMGNAFAMQNLAYCFKSGSGVVKDVRASIAWYHKAAEAGNTSCMHFLGTCYHHGDLVEENSRTAMEWYRRAAELGYVPAMHHLGTLYEDDNNFSEALRWYHQAANAGNGPAMGRLGQLQLNGLCDGVKDVAKALQWFRKAVKAGDEASVLHLMKMYESGTDVAVDVEQITSWSRKGLYNDPPYKPTHSPVN